MKDIFLMIYQLFCIYVFNDVVTDHMVLSISRFSSTGLHVVWSNIQRFINVIEN